MPTSLANLNNTDEANDEEKEQSVTDYMGQGSSDTCVFMQGCLYEPVQYSANWVCIIKLDCRA